MQWRRVHAIVGEPNPTRGRRWEDDEEEDDEEEDDSEEDEGDTTLALGRQRRGRRGGRGVWAAVGPVVQPRGRCGWEEARNGREQQEEPDKRPWRRRRGGEETR